MRSLDATLRLRLLFWGPAVGVLLFVAAITRLGSRWPSVYVMTGPSMEPTIEAGRYFIAWSPVGRVVPGDLVLFRYEDEDGVFHVLRRLAAMPGDTIAMDSGTVIVNGRRQSWQFQIIKPSAFRSPYAIEEHLHTWGPWVVPEDSVILLSDTRDMVGWPDSRFIGPVAMSDLVARATRTVQGRRIGGAR